LSRLLLGMEHLHPDQAPLLQPEKKRRLQYPEPVDHTAAEIDRGGVREILGRAAQLPYAVAEPGDLRQHLVVKDEVVRVFPQRERLQQFAGKGPVAGMVLRELLAQEYVFDQGQEPVGNVLVERHPSFEGAGSQDAGGKHRVEFVEGDHGGHGGNEFRRVLVVRVEHDDDIGPHVQRCQVAGLLVSTVSQVLFVDDRCNAETRRHGGGIVTARIVDQNHAVHKLEGDLMVGHLQGL